MIGDIPRKLDDTTLNRGCVIDIIKDAILINTQFPRRNPIWVELFPSLCFNRCIVGEMRCDSRQNDALFMRPEIGQIGVGTWKDDDREFHMRLSTPANLPHPRQRGLDYTLSARPQQGVFRTDVLLHDSQSVGSRNKPADTQVVI